MRGQVRPRVAGEQRLEFLIKLRAQGLIVGDYQCRPLGSFDHAGDGKSLAAASDAEQYLILRPVTYTAGQCVNRLRLVATGTIVRFQGERHKRK